MRSRYTTSLIFLVLLVLVGTTGYHLIEGWSFFDSAYMTVITLSTVGYGELRPLSALGRMFTAGLILLGVGTLAFVATRTAEALFEDRRLLHRRRTSMEIKRLSGHVIVCGFGRMGVTVAEHLHGRAVPLVVVDRDAETEAGLHGRNGAWFLRGDATDDSVLIEAGVQRARALAAVMPHDADNLFVTLSARALNPDVTIVARASNAKNETKMLTAGATRVLNPFRNGGRLMVRQLLHPSVTEFLAVVSESGPTGLALEEVQLQEGSPLVGVMLRDAPIRRELDLIVVAVRRSPTREMIFNPPHDLAPQANDVLLVLGRGESLRRLEQLAEGAGAG